MCDRCDYDAEPKPKPGAFWLEPDFPRGRRLGFTRVRPRALKQAMAEQDSACAYCLSPLTEATATVDHVIPLAQGGTHRLANLVVACGSCNSMKNARTVEQWAAVA